MRLYSHKRDDRSGFVTLHLTDRHNIRLEWSLLSKLYGADVEVDEEGMTLSLRLGLVCGWLHFTVPGNRNSREWGVSFHDGGIWFSLGQDKWDGRPKVFRPLDFLLGSHRYEKVTTSTHDVLIPMPEKSYPAKVEMSTMTWKRPRWPFWPFTITRYDAWIDIPGGVPHPSRKWADDGLFGTGASSRPGERMVTPEDAIGRVVASVLEDRRRYGKGYYDTGAREAV